MSTPGRVRITTIIKDIENGHYDDDIGALQDAIRKRNILRRESVNKLVREVYGPDYKVISPAEQPTIAPDPGLWVPKEDQPSPNQMQFEGTQDTLTPNQGLDDTPGEGKGPQIGGFSVGDMN